MAVYWLTYRIDGDGKGDERRFALKKAVHGYQIRYWDRTPNFVLFESGHTFEFLAQGLHSRLDLSRDLLVLGEIGSSKVHLWGANTDDDILVMLPHCRDGVR